MVKWERAIKTEPNIGNSTKKIMIALIGIIKESYQSVKYATLRLLCTSLLRLLTMALAIAGACSHREKKMKCPDCNTEMIYKNTMYLDYKDSTQELAYPYWKCPKCKIEIDEETGEKNET